MKKLLILSAIAFFAFVGTKTYAAGTAVAPEIGETHTYYVNSIDGGTTENSGVGDTYTWWISTNTGDLTAVDGSADYSDAGGAAYNTPTVDGFKILITWNPASAGNTYYLVVKETDATGCSNLKSVAIQPVNNFTLVYSALKEDGTTETDNYSQCAPDIALTASGTTITYDYGQGDYLFKLTPSGIAAGWSFDQSLSTNTYGAATETVTYSVDGGTTYNPVTATINVPAGTAYVLIKVNLNDGTAEEGTTAQSLVLDITNITDGTNAPTNVYQSDGTTAFGAAPYQQSQTVNARPATTGIGYN